MKRYHAASNALHMAVTNCLSNSGGDDSHSDWMTGTFDTGGGVMELTRQGGRYEYANGRLSDLKINGAVMEGTWTQDSSGQKCADGGYHGRFRLVFTETGFSGLFGYCDEVPAAQAGSTARGGNRGYFPRRLRCVSRSSTAESAPSGNSPSRRATS